MDNVTQAREWQRFAAMDAEMMNALIYPSFFR